MSCQLGGRTSFKRGSLMLPRAQIRGFVNCLSDSVLILAATISPKVAVRDGDIPQYDKTLVLLQSYPLALIIFPFLR